MTVLRVIVKALGAPLLFRLYLPTLNKRGMAGSGTLLEEIGAGAPSRGSAHSMLPRRLRADTFVSYSTGRAPVKWPIFSSCSRSRNGEVK